MEEAVIGDVFRQFFNLSIDPTRLLLLILSLRNKQNNKTSLPFKGYEEEFEDSSEEVIGESGVVTDAGSSARQRIPWLMLAPEPEEFDSGLRRFYCLETGTTRRIPIPYAANLEDSRCYSSNGWLLTLSRSLSMSLVNPFTGVVILLPDGSDGSLDEFEDFFDRPKGRALSFMDKFVLSSPLPSADEAGENASYSVAIICGGVPKLALWRSGDDAWTRVRLRIEDIDPEEYEDEDDLELTGMGDVVYYRGKFYALCNHGFIYACGFDPDRPEVATARLMFDLSKSDCFYQPTKLYLVVSHGKLLIVSRKIASNRDVHNPETRDDNADDHGVDQDQDEDEDEDMNIDRDMDRDINEYMDGDMVGDDQVDGILGGNGVEDEEGNGHDFCHTGEFLIFRVTDENKEDGGLELVNDLGGESLFLGDNQSISIKASECPGCKPNCIYFTDDWYSDWPHGRGPGTDMGIYNLKDGNIQPYYQVDDSFMSSVGPLWVHQPSC